MASEPAVIIGYDAVSPLGIDLDNQWRSALDGRCGIGPLTRFDPAEDFPVRIAGQVDPIDHLDYPFLKPRQQARWPSPIFKYAQLTVSRALDACGIEITPKLAPRIAVTYSSAVGGLDAVLSADRRMIGENKLPAPFINPNSCINMVGGVISIMTGATGPISSTITACATGVTSMIVAAMLIERGRADVAICGAVDFALVEPIVAGFATMGGAFVPKEGAPEEAPQAASRPFSIHRRGFVIAEGAGCILLASQAFAKAHGLRQHAQIAGWAMTSDAYHYVAPNFDTVRRCIKECIDDAGIVPEQIDAVNAHATSTRVGDQVQFDALNDIFDGTIPPVTANKSLFGHAMGASSAIESIFAIKGMQSGQLPPTINYTPDPALPIDCVSEGARALDQQYVLKNAFGFGGCNSCMIFKKVHEP
jgi:3-oxoacyl-[acyl-carrier-protein] synthase II